MKSRKYRLLVLLATAISLTTGCGFRSMATDPAALEAQFESAKQEERQLLVKVVEDPERTKVLVMLLEERNEMVAVHADTVEAYIDEMRVLNANYNATREDFESVITEYRSVRQAYQRNMVGNLDKMKATTTAKEWKQLAKFHLKKLNPREMIQSKSGA